MFFKAPTPTVEADLDLLQFADYDDYVNFHTNFLDICYLGSKEVIRAIIDIGSKTTCGLSEDEFNKRLQAVKEFFQPSYKPLDTASRGIICTDPFLIALAIRERANRVGIISRIIHLRCKLKSGAEISGYIDYGDRLLRQDWKPIFKGEVLLKPDNTDLGYYNWQTGETATNNSVYFKASYNQLAQLVYRHNADRKNINLDPRYPPGYNSTRTRIKTPLYEACSLIDHVLRQRR